MRLQNLKNNRFLLNFLCVNVDWTRFHMDETLIIDVYINLLIVSLILLGRRGAVSNCNHDCCRFDSLSEK